MRIVFFGVEALGERCLSALLEARHEVVGVVTLPSEPAPLRPWYARLLSKPKHRSVEAIARSHRFPILMPLTLRDQRFLEQLEGLGPDLLVVACFDKILPKAALAVATRGGVNVHPSLLPRHRGPAPVARAILAGDHETGVTIHLMEATVDTGAILVQRRHPIRADDTAGSLAERLADLAPKALLEALDGYLSGSNAPLPQQGQVRLAPFIAREEGHLDWRAGVGRVMRTIRACSPYPGAFAVTRQEVVSILKAVLATGDPDAVPGQVLEVGPEGIVIQAGDGAIRCQELRAGGRILSAAQYGEFFAVGELLPPGDWAALEAVD